MYKLLAQKKTSNEDWWPPTWGKLKTLNDLYKTLQDSADTINYYWKIIEEPNEKE